MSQRAVYRIRRTHARYLTATLPLWRTEHGAEALNSINKCSEDGKGSTAEATTTRTCLYVQVLVAVVTLLGDYGQTTTCATFDNEHTVNSILLNIMYNVDSAH